MSSAGKLLPLLAAVIILAAPAALAGENFEDVQNRVHEKTLSNGLKVILFENHDAPVVSFVTQANVGASDEVHGITGLAHILEHMAFKGTGTVGGRDTKDEARAMTAEDRAFAAVMAEREKGDLASPEKLAELEKVLEEAMDEARQYVLSNEMDEILNREGVQGLNAGTGYDTTTYYYSLPSNRLELWALLESDRFINPVLREFYAEKQVVAEERRMRTDSNPIGRLLEEYLAVAYKAHPYGVPVVGHMSDIQNMSREKCMNFFRKYYNPSNMVVVLAGDVTPDEAFPVIENYFGAIPRGTKPSPVTTMEPKQNAERRVVTYEEAQPILIMGFHKPGFNHPERAVYDAISDIMGSGRSSRLHKSLVKEKQIAIASMTITGLPGSKYPGLFLFIGVPAKGHTNAEVEEAIWEEIDKLKNEPVSEAELTKLQTRAKADFIRGLDSNTGMANQLAFYHTMTGNWRDMFQEVEKIEAVTAEEIQRVANEVFTRTNLSVGAQESLADLEP
jgi:predicted Zn-dependent peptidase